MAKMVKCKVLSGHRYGYIDRSDGEFKRVLAQPGDHVTVSEVAAKRFSHSLMPIEKPIKREDRKVDIEKANKELAGMSAEQIEEEVAIKAGKPVSEAKSTKSTKSTESTKSTK